MEYNYLINLYILKAYAQEIKAWEMCAFLEEVEHVIS